MREHEEWEIASQVLWHFGEGGVEPGSFVKALLAAFAAADPGNFRRLAEAYSRSGVAMAMALRDPNGIAELQRIAAKAGAAS